MTLESLRSARPSAAVRAILVGEVVLYVSALAAYIWWIAPTGFKLRPMDVPLLILAAGIPIALNLLHGDRPADSGLRIDNIRASAGEVAIATAVMAGVLIVAAFVSDGWHWISWRRLGDKAGMYLVWGVVQQYLLQSFAMRRFRQAGLAVPWAALAAAGVFAILHLPNWGLVAVTTPAAVVWCMLFARRPNIITLGLAHGFLAVLAYHALPERWLHGMTIGREFLRHVAG